MYISHIRISSETSYITQMNAFPHSHMYISHMYISHIRISSETNYITQMNAFLTHIWKSQATRMNESRHTHIHTAGRRRRRLMPYTWVTPHTCMSHVAHIQESRHMNELCHTCEWVTSHIWLSHVTHTNESRHSFEWVVSHIWMSHVTYIIQVRDT